MNQETKPISAEMHLLAVEFEQHLEMKELASYLNRGRRFAHLSDEELGNDWVAAVQAIFHRREGQIDMADLGSEHSMRSIEPPREAVRKEMRQFREELSQMSVAERQARFRLGQAVDEFMAERNRPPH